MSVSLSKEKIRNFSKDEYPHYYLYQHRPLLTCRSWDSISKGAMFQDNPLERQKFKFGHQIDIGYPELKIWDVIQSEVYQGDADNICTGFVVSWCKEAVEGKEPTLLTRKQIRTFSDDEFPDFYLAYYVPIATIRGVATDTFKGGIYLPNPFVIPDLNKGFQFRKKCPEMRHFEIIHSELYKGDRSNVCNGVVVCWYKEI